MAVATLQTEMPSTEAPNDPAQQELQANLDATSRLLRIGSLFLQEGNLEYVLGEIVEAAIAIAGADFGNIQLLDRESGDLRIVAYRGFPPWWLAYWDSVHRGHGACGTALEHRARVVVPDIEHDPIFVGTEALEIQLRAGVRAVQSTPLVARTGEPIGMMSTHFRQPTVPDEHRLKLIDLVARQAADIVERARIEQELRDSESRLHALVDVSADVLYHMSPDWTEMRELTSRGFLVDTPVRTDEWMVRYIPPEEQPRVKAAIERAVATQQVFDLEHRVVRADGTSGWTWSRAVPIKDPRGKIVEWFGAASDVTDRKRAELELADANERLRDADRRKNDFLAVLSHELRNPLASISMSLDLLDRVPPGSKQAQRCLPVMRRQFDHLTRLIDDLLDVTRISSGRIALRREAVDLAELVRRTVDDQRDAFVRAGLALELVTPAEPIRIDGDPTRLAQILGNLLHNALKFTPAGGKVTVSVSRNTSLGQALLTVQDTGRGIPPDILPRVFEPFVQADTTLDRAKGGLGLGLAVARGLVELHGGTIVASCDQGTTFVITLPLGEPASVPAPASKPGEQQAARRRVLVIEDNVDTADALRSLLELDGYDTDVAYDGVSGVAHAHSFAPDVIVCDVGLPEMDGYEVARALRSDPELGKVALVALPGYGSAADVERARQAGFTEHLTKPIGEDDLARVLTKLTG